MENMRLTTHNGRTTAAGEAYSPRHNDRNKIKADHIDRGKGYLNWYWHCMQKNNLQMTFEDMEKAFYKIHCTDHVNAQNARYEAQRHPERCKSLDDYRKAQQTCPEETIYMIGNKDNHIPAKMLKNICSEFIDWEQKRFPGVHVLSIAMHCDEEGAPHIHERKAWLYVDKDGHKAIGQGKVLEQLGIERPYPEKPKSRYNNPKQTYTKLCREKLFEICKAHGLELIQAPKERSRSGLSQAEYQTRQEEARAHMAEFKRKAAERTYAALEDESRQYRQGIEQAEEQMDNLQSDLLEISHQVHIEQQTLKDLQAEVEQLGLQCQNARRELKTLTKSTEKEHKRLQAIRNTREQAASEFREYKQNVDAYKAKCQDNLQELRDYMTEAQYNRAWYLSRENEWPEH